MSNGDASEPGFEQSRAPGAKRGVVDFPPEILALMNSQDPVGSQEKQAFVKSLIIPHRKFKEAVNVIGMAHNALSNDKALGADFALVAGRSRSGKSTAVKYYASMFASHAGAHGMRAPVVYLEAPAECTVLALLNAILVALEVPHKGLKTRDDRILAIKHHLREQGVQLLIVDEYQHFVDKRTNRFQHAAGDLLKGMLNQNACQMIFAGLLSSDSALTVNDQAEGRLHSRYEMGPYLWNDQADRISFLSFLAAVAKNLPFDAYFDMKEETFAARLYIATDGLVGRVMLLTAKATGIAADRLARGLRLSDFASAFDMSKRHGVVSNPFRGKAAKVPKFAQNLLDGEKVEKSGLRSVRLPKERDSLSKKRA